MEIILIITHYFINALIIFKGFTTRGTIISDRLTAWRNLEEATRPSGQFAINPKDILIHRNVTFFKPKIKKNNKKKKTKQFKNFSKVSLFFHSARYNSIKIISR